jgi:predicted nucleic acid-binding protein
LIAYFDTSAVVPLLVADEPGIEVCRRTWSMTDSVVTSRLLYVEAAAALAQAARMDRLTEAAHERALLGLDILWEQFDIVEVGGTLIRRAARLAREQGLRGYDAVHCAAALEVADPATVAVSGDQDRLVAWRAEGLDVVDTLA